VNLIPPEVQSVVEIPKDVLDRFVALFQVELRYWHEMFKDEPDDEAVDLIIDELHERIEAVKDIAIIMQTQFGINIRGGN
jgi:hypothetical protein